MTRRARFAALGVVVAFLLALTVATGLADPSSPAIEEKREPPAWASADSEYNRGVRARVARDWKAAESAFRSAVALRPAFPDAWNELGYALRNQGRYAESLKAYDEALKQRPNFPEALEYLGEAYVKMGRLEDARRILVRLRALDTARAQELAETIQKGQ
ncbi:MAG TPA: tetratricopeptide repeat protein [Methylomirabilota bacterium]|nr:tetratricopeptide repeat protein [Methylomirabilota bacterium]